MGVEYQCRPKNYILHDGIKNPKVQQERKRFCGRPLTTFNLAYIWGDGGVWWLVGGVLVSNRQATD